MKSIKKILAATFGIPFLMMYSAVIGTIVYVISGSAIVSIPASIAFFFWMMKDIDLNKDEVKPPSKKSTETELDSSSENNFDHECYHNGHSVKEWEDIGLKVSNKYKKTTKKYYSFNEIEVSAFSLKYPHLTSNQRKVKILGGALVKRVKSKKHASQILINQYGFKKSTAEYAVGYEGYHDW